MYRDKGIRIRQREIEWTDRKERGQRDQDRRTGKREIHSDKDLDWDIDRTTGTEGCKN